MKALAIAIVLSLQVANTSPDIVPPREVQHMLRPILDACVVAQTIEGKRREAEYYHATQLVGKLLNATTRSRDEALVVLMNFYTGESSGEDIVHQITVRGKRMLPLLYKYRKARVAFPGADYPSSIFLPMDVKESLFDEAITNIRQGRVAGED